MGRKEFKFPNSKFEMLLFDWSAIRCGCNEENWNKVSYFVQCIKKQLIKLQSFNSFNIQTCFSQFFWFFNLKGLVQLQPRLYSGWGFLPSQWDRQLKFSTYAWFMIFWSLSKFELNKTTFIFYCFLGDQRKK